MEAEGGHARVQDCDNGLKTDTKRTVGTVLTRIFFGCRKESKKIPQYSDFRALRDFAQQVIMRGCRRACVTVYG
jgi:hypothetical protein